jgi:2'-5' RNA ligase
VQEKDRELMTYSIHFNFDRDAEEQIRNIYFRFAENKLAPYMHNSCNRPHIGLCMFESYTGNLDSHLHEYCLKLDRFEICFQSLGIFPGENPAVFLSPVVTFELLSAHKLLYEMINNDISQAQVYYLPNNWVPHSSIGYKIRNNDLGRIIEEANTLSMPIMARIESISLIQIPVTSIREYTIT